MTATRLQKCGNGRYWQGVYHDDDGKRCFINGIGTVAEVSEDDARAMVEKFVGHRNPSTVEGWCSRYLDMRTDLSPNTVTLMETTAARLIAHMGATVIDDVTPLMAEEFKASITDVATSTASAHVHRARAIFAAAVRYEIIERNPFDAVKIAKPPPSDDWRYVTLAEFERIIEHCPSLAWCNLFALTRLAGLRSGSRGGEALGLLWDAVDFDTKTLTVTDQKRHRTRIVPMSPRLVEILLASPRDSGRVCELNTVHARAKTIIKAAGVEAYEKPFHSLRKSCVQDLLRAGHPAAFVAMWMGHSARVMLTNYFTGNDAVAMRRVSNPSGVG